MYICVELHRTGIFPISCLKTRDTQQLLEKNVDTESSCFFLFFSWSWVPNGQTSVQLDSNYLQKSNKGLQKSRKFRKCQKCGEKHQNGHISTIWPPNENLRALSFLQLSKLKKIKCPHFLDLWPLGWDIAIYSISWFGSKLKDINKMTKWQYLSPQAKNLKNKGTFFSPTLKVEERKVPSDFRLEAIWLSYGHFDVFLQIFDIF